VSNKIHIEKELLVRFQWGDVHAFDDIYRRFNRGIFNFAYYLLKSREDSENIVQEVFIKIWEKKDQIRNLDAFHSYIFTITHNIVISLIREKIKDHKFKNHLISLQEPFEEKIHVDLEISEIRKTVANALTKMTERQREIYLMHCEENLTYREIAKKLNISLNTVANHMSNAYKLIRKYLNSSSLAISIFIHMFQM